MDSFSNFVRLHETPGTSLVKTLQRFDVAVKSGISLSEIISSTITSCPFNIPSFNKTPDIPGIVAFSITVIPALTNLPLAVPVDATATTSSSIPPFTVILLIIVVHFFSFAQFNISLAVVLCNETSSVRYDEITATLSLLLTKMRVG